MANILPFSRTRGRGEGGKDEEVDSTTNCPIPPFSLSLSFYGPPICRAIVPLKSDTSLKVPTSQTPIAPFDCLFSTATHAK